jgi:hypothetical protein
MMMMVVQREDERDDVLVYYLMEVESAMMIEVVVVRQRLELEWEVKQEMRMLLVSMMQNWFEQLADELNEQHWHYDCLMVYNLFSDDQAR